MKTYRNQQKTYRKPKGNYRKPTKLQVMRVPWPKKTYRIIGNEGPWPKSPVTALSARTVQQMMPNMLPTNVPRVIPNILNGA